jgi:23S rRNA (cytosine1962-C5)-methyltransferase
MHPLLQAALNRRSPLPNHETTAFRWIDGAGDGIPGVEIEEFGDKLLVSTRFSELPKSVISIVESLPSTLYIRHLDSDAKTSPRHFSGPVSDSPFHVLENGVTLELSFQSGYSQGIFLDQRDNRNELRGILQPGQTLLNTFAYTGAFSVFGALAGATTTTIDLSQPYLDWSRRNFHLNQLDPNDHYFCRGDTFHWLRRFAKQGRRFEAIVLDPPTFSRDHKGKVFRVQKDYGELIELADRCLTPGGTILACTNCRQLSETDFIKQIRTALPRPIDLRCAPMPFDFTAPPYLKSVWIR